MVDPPYVLVEEELCALRKRSGISPDKVMRLGKTIMDLPCVTHEYLRNDASVGRPASAVAAIRCAVKNLGHPYSLVLRRTLALDEGLAFDLTRRREDWCIEADIADLKKIGLPLEKRAYQLLAQVLVDASESPCVVRGPANAEVLVLNEVSRFLTWKAGRVATGYERLNELLLASTTPGTDFLTFGESVRRLIQDVGDEDVELDELRRQVDRVLESVAREAAYLSNGTDGPVINSGYTDAVLSLFPIGSTPRGFRELSIALRLHPWDEEQRTDRISRVYWPLKRKIIDFTATELLRSIAKSDHLWHNSNINECGETT